MAIDYIINRDCPVKETLGSEGIIHLVKSRTRGRALMRMLMDDGRSQQEALATSVEMQINQADGEVNTREVPVRQMLKEAALLDDYAHECKECPVNLLESYGCYQSINYPISGKAERWLARMADAAIKAEFPNNILINFILDEQLDGVAFGDLRKAAGGKYLELSQPLEILVQKKMLKKITINTNQILDMLFAVGTMRLTHQQFIQFFSGGLKIQSELPDMDRVGKDFQAGLTTDKEGNDLFLVYRLKNEKSDDRCIRQIKAFMRASFAAYCSGSSITIDY